MDTCSCRLAVTAVLCLSGVFTCGPPALAQESRGKEHEQAQTVKASVLVPPSSNIVERGLKTLKSLGLFTGARDGVYPEVTSVYPGGWIAFGGGYRRPVGDRGAFTLRSAWSLKAYRDVEASLALPDTIADGLTLEVTGRWMDAPTVQFFGVGNDTRPGDRTTYAYRPTTFGVTLRGAPSPRLTWGGGLDYLVIDTVTTTADPSSAAPEVTTAPGLGQAPQYLRSRGFARFDWRKAPGYTGSGGLYRVEVQDYADRSGSALSFRSAEAEAVQLLPILRANWVIALRGLATVTDTGAGDAVPFYLMPSLGGSDAVRGYPSFRFVGNHRVLMSGELRWTATRYLDMALFYDTGKVAQRLEDLDLRDRRSAYGVGARFHGLSRTVLRIEVARSDAGTWRLVWTSGASF